MKKIILLTIMALLVMTVFVSAETPTGATQQFNKIFLNPFYLSSMTAGQAYNFTVNVNPPDRISSVVSAIVTFDMWISPTVTFNVTVNNQACRNPLYVISTTYSSAGRGVATFDCGNVITGAGTYTITMRPTQQNTGALTAWLDLTYMNNPSGTFELSGTDYYVGDKGTIFLQLKDSQNNAVNNGACLLDLYAPNSYNSTHPEILNDAPMVFKEEGLYYYDYNIPNYTGVYMVNAKCSYAESGTWTYLLSADTDGPDRTVIAGTFYGDTIFLNGYDDWIYTECAAGGGKVCTADYDFNTTRLIAQPINASTSSFALYYMGEASVAQTMTFQWWNWSAGAWVSLPNTLTFSGLASSAPIGIGDFVTNTVPGAAYNSTTGIIRIRTTMTHGSTFTVYSNWLNLLVNTPSGSLIDVKGSGELNVHALPEIAAAAAVWNYTNRNLTYYEPTVIDNLAVAGSVWNYTDRNLTYTPDMTNYTLIGSNVSASVESARSNITGTLSPMDTKLDNILSAFANIAANVWSYVGRYVHGILV